MPERSDLPQGTLDLLILQVVAAGAIHGYGIAQRLQLISRDVVRGTAGARCIPLCTGSKTAGC